MKSKIIMFSVIAAIFAFAISYDMITTSRPQVHTYTPKSAPEAPSAAAAWDPVPPLTFQTVDGREFTLDEFEGKVVLLNFWASWCPPCVVEFPALLELIRRYDGRVVLLALSCDEDVEGIERFLGQFRDNHAEDLQSPFFRLAWDPDRSITTDIFNTAAFPETIIITPDKRMAKKVVGDTAWNGPAMTVFLDGLLKTSR